MHYITDTLAGNTELVVNCEWIYIVNIDMVYIAEIDRLAHTWEKFGETQQA